MECIKEQILKAYYFRHACKEFDDSKKISEEDFNFILETGRLSPSSFGFEPWRLIVVKSPELRDKIRFTSWGAFGKLPAASHFVIILARTIKDLRYDSQYILNFMKEIQHTPEDIVNKRLEAYKNFQENDFKLLESDRAIFDWACKQTYIVMANMMTSAAQIGIDSCPIEGFDREKLEQMLEHGGVIDRNRFGVSCMVAFGYRKADPKRPKTRQPMESFVEWV